MCHADRLSALDWRGWLFIGLRTSGVLYAGAIELVEIPVAGAPRDVLVMRGRDARTHGTRVRACACAGGAVCQQSAFSCAQGGASTRGWGDLARYVPWGARPRGSCRWGRRKECTAAFRGGTCHRTCAGSSRPVRWEEDVGAGGGGGECVSRTAARSQGAGGERAARIEVCSLRSPSDSGTRVGSSPAGGSAGSCRRAGGGHSWRGTGHRRGQSPG